MIIGYDAKRAFCNRRGLGNYSRDVIRLMSSYYPENQYLLFTPKQQDDLFAPDPAIAQTHLPTSFLGKKIPAYWRSCGICKEIKTAGAGIYHGLSQELPFGIGKTGIKSVVTMHDAIFIRYPELYDPLYRTIFTKKNRYSCKVADRIIAISEQTKRDIIEFFDADEQKIDVVYQGCNNSFRNPVSADEIEEVKKRHHLPQQFLLTVGAIERRKNQEIIIEALHKGNIDIPLVIIGNPTNYLKEIEKKITEYSLDRQIVVLNNISSADLPAIYHAASCLIYPSIFEGFGLPILEALCTGTPVITSQGSCFEETGGEAARYINPYDAEDTATAIRQVLTDSELRKSMIKKGLLHADEFTDEKVAQKIMNVYIHL